MSDFLEQNLDEIHTSFFITTSLNDLFHDVENELNLIENCPKVHGEMLMAWMRINHPGAYLTPTTISLGGSIQDSRWEGEPSVFINNGYYMAFIMKRFCFTDNLLQKNLFAILPSVEITELLRVHVVMKISIGITIRWLIAKTHGLG